MLTGSDPSAWVAALAPFREIDVLGANCAFGPFGVNRECAIHY